MTATQERMLNVLTVNTGSSGLRLCPERKAFPASTAGAPIHTNDGTIELWVTRTGESRVTAEATVGLLAPLTPST